MTVKLDITKIKESEQKLYPTLLHSITNIVNRHEEFRTAFNSNKQSCVFCKLKLKPSKVIHGIAKILKVLAGRSGLASLLFTDPKARISRLYSS